jgi:hypothetical protein
MFGRVTASKPAAAAAGSCSHRTLLVLFVPCAVWSKQRHVGFVTAGLYAGSRIHVYLLLVYAVCMLMCTFLHSTQNKTRCQTLGRHLKAGVCSVWGFRSK